jgi:hypothetical protein
MVPSTGWDDAMWRGEWTVKNTIIGTLSKALPNAAWLRQHDAGLNSGQHSSGFLALRVELQR